MESIKAEKLRVIAETGADARQQFDQLIEQASAQDAKLILAGMRLLACTLQQIAIQSV